MKLIKGEFKEKSDLLFALSIRAGYPNSTEEYPRDRLGFNKDMIKHPEAMFYGCVEGDSMIGLGIDEGDIAVIDKSIEAEHGDVVVAFIEGDFNVKLLNLTHKKDGYIKLKSANPNAPNFRISEYDNFEVWGVVR